MGISISVLLFFGFAQFSYAVNLLQSQQVSATILENAVRASTPLGFAAMACDPSAFTKRKAVCGKGTEQRVNRVKAILGAIPAGLDTKGRTEWLMRENGVDLKALEAHFSKVKSTLTTHLKTEFGFSESDRALMIQELENTRLVHGLSENLSPTTATIYQKYCGNPEHDSMVISKMIYRTETVEGNVIGHFENHAIMICPGILASLATIPTIGDEQNHAPAKILTHYLGHELGHVIHGVRNDAVWDIFDNGVKKVTNFTRSYDEFAGCYRKFHLGELSETGTHELNADYMKYMNRVLGRKPDRVDTHLAELTGDYYGSIALGYILPSKSDVSQDLEFFLSSNLEQFCDDWLDFGAGVHPTVLFRFNQILGNPVIRDALDCPKALPAKKPFCTIQGAQYE